MVNKDINPTNGSTIMKSNIQDSVDDVFNSYATEQIEFQEFDLNLLSLVYPDDSNTLVQKKEKKYFQIANIHMLNSLRLNKPLSISIEFDVEHYLTKSVDFPIYAIGDDVDDAISNLKTELEDLYYELIEDDDFSDEWLRYKKLLKELIIG